MEVDSENRADVAVDAKAQTKEEVQEMAKTEEAGEELSLTVTYKGEKFQLSLASTSTVAELKEDLQVRTKVPVAMQKLVGSGVKTKEDGATLSTAGLKSGGKLMLVGSTMDEVLKAATKPTAAELKASTVAAAPKEKFSAQTAHQKVIAKGIPDDAMPGILGAAEELPEGASLRGMRNKHGSKVRLTFKLAEDQLWIATPERTEKVGLGSINAVVAEPIVGHEHYSLLAFQLGPTEASRLWLYWVPSQYVAAIKRAVN